MSKPCVSRGILASQLCCELCTTQSQRPAFSCGGGCQALKELYSHPSTQQGLVPDSGEAGRLVLGVW